MSNQITTLGMVSGHAYDRWVEEMRASVERHERRLRLFKGARDISRRNSPGVKASRLILLKRARKALCRRAAALHYGLDAKLAKHVLDTLVDKHPVDTEAE